MIKLLTLIFGCTLSGLISFPCTAYGATENQSNLPQLPNQCLKLPLVRQARNYTCGVAALQSVLGYYGDDVREDILSKKLHADRKNGTARLRIAHYAEQQGLRVEMKDGMDEYELRRWLDEKKPVICLIQAWSDKPTDYSKDWNNGHYVVAIGYDQDNFYFVDPSMLGHYTFIPLNEFLERWHDTDGATTLHHFGMAVFKPDAVLNPGAVLKTE